jgi:hypothetical protein
MQSAYERNMVTRSRNHRCSGKAISIIYSECWSIALFMQQAKRMRFIIFSGGLPDSCMFFPHYLINSTIFG